MAREMDCPQCWGTKPACEYCRGRGKVPDRQLSPHFWLSEFLKSNKARRNGLCQVPTEAQIANATSLCTELIEPIRAVHGPVELTSGIRCTIELNRLIGGSLSSSHLYLKQANGADGAFRVPRRDVMLWAKDAPVVFDQLIFEERRKATGELERWLHMSSRHADGRRRRQLLMCFDGKTYLQFNPNDPRVRS